MQLTGSSKISKQQNVKVQKKSFKIKKQKVKNWKQEQEDQNKKKGEHWSVTSYGIEGTKHHIKICDFLEYFSIQNYL